MSVYKEGYIITEQLQNSALRIFNDACDYGTPVKVGDENWNNVRQLFDFYGEKESRKVQRYATGTTASFDFTLIDEWAVSDERKTVEQATENYRLEFVTCDKGRCKGYNGYITITRL